MVLNSTVIHEFALGISWSLSQMTCPNQIPNFGQMPQGHPGGGGRLLYLELTDTLLKIQIFTVGFFEICSHFDFMTIQEWQNLQKCQIFMILLILKLTLKPYFQKFRTTMLC